MHHSTLFGKVPKIRGKYFGPKGRDTVGKKTEKFENFEIFPKISQKGARDGVFGLRKNVKI